MGVEGGTAPGRYPHLFGGTLGNLRGRIYRVLASKGIGDVCPSGMQDDYGSYSVGGLFTLPEELYSSLPPSAGSRR